MDENSVQPVELGTAQVVARLCGNVKLTDLLTNAATVWQGIIEMQAYLSERDCSKFMSDVNNSGTNMLNATPQLRAEVFIKVFKKV